jgi:uncharacterized protein (DUF58 family)
MSLRTYESVRLASEVSLGISHSPRYSDVRPSADLESSGNKSSAENGPYPPAGSGTSSKAVQCKPDARESESETPAASRLFFSSLAKRWWQTFIFLINYDFCPFANRWVLWITRPWVCLVLGSIASFLCALFINSNAYLLLGATSLILGLGVVWPWICISGLRCRLTFESQRSREGETSPVRMTLVNRWPWPVYGISLVRGLGREAMAEAGVSMVCLAGRSQTEYRWNFRAPHRGLFPTEGAWLETAFPFGLVRASRQVEITSQLLAWPATVALNTLPSGGESSALDDNRLCLRVGDLGDLLGTRGFRQGDSLRRVHWAQTARQQRMIVCERQAPEQLAVRIQLDLDPQMHDGEGTHCTLEQAIRITGSLFESFHRMHIPVECRMGERSFVLGTGPTDLRRVLDVLAQLPTRAELPPVSRDWNALNSTRHRSQSLLNVFVTTQKRLRSTLETERSSGMDRRWGSSQCFRPQRDSFVLAVSNDSRTSSWLARTDDSPGASGVGEKWRLVDASSHLLVEELPRAWRSLAHAG